MLEFQIYLELVLVVIKKLKEINDAVIISLQEEGKKLGADAIVGLKIDNGDISGTGLSMFMVTAVGTAVKIKPLFDEFSDEELLNMYTTSRNSDIHKELLLRKFPQSNIDLHIQKIEEQNAAKIAELSKKQDNNVSEIQIALESQRVRFIECSRCGCKNYISYQRI